MWVPVTMPEKNKNVCDFLEGSSCPIEGGKQHKWLIDIPIDSANPAITSDLRVKILDGSTVVMCLLLPVKVT